VLGAPSSRALYNLLLLLLLGIHFALITITKDLSSFPFPLHFSSFCTKKERRLTFLSLLLFALWQQQQQ